MVVRFGTRKAFQGARLAMGALDLSNLQSVLYVLGQVKVSKTVGGNSF